MESAMEKVKRFTLAGVADRIKCPFLILWGTQDKLTPREVAHQLYDNVGSKDKTLKIFDEDEGGAEHCQVDNRQVGTDYICDWLVKRLAPITKGKGKRGKGRGTARKAKAKDRKGKR
jgi:cephalosporin-C deacetylase-like acetyl esterase